MKLVIRNGTCIEMTASSLRGLCSLEEQQPKLMSYRCLEGVDSGTAGHVVVLRGDVLAPRDSSLQTSFAFQIKDDIEPDPFSSKYLAACKS